MPRPKPGYTRPTSVPCMVCTGDVQVLPVGNVPEGHAACMQLRRDLARLIGALEPVAQDRSPKELRLIASFLASELQGIRNSFVNKHANPAKKR